MGNPPNRRYILLMAHKTAYPWILHRLEQIGKNQGQLADFLGIDRGNFNRTFKSSGKSKLRRLKSEEAVRIADYLDMPIEWVEQGEGYKKPPAIKEVEAKEFLTDTEVALLDCIKILFKAITGYGICSEEALSQTLSYQFDEYEHRGYPNAMETMKLLQEYVTGKPHRSEKEIIGRLLHIRPLGSA